MPIDKQTVEHTAHLARLELGAEELTKLSAQMQDILSFIDKLGQLDITDAAAAVSPIPIINVLRQDINKPSLSIEDSLSNAPSKQGAFFAAPKVID